jgi:hypothetical protein
MLIIPFENEGWGGGEKKDKTNMRICTNSVVQESKKIPKI